jgi:integrase
MLEFTDHLVGRSNQISVGRRPANKGRRYPADPPRVEEIVAVMRQAGTDNCGQRLRGLIIVLWRAGLRISEALALTESDPRLAPGVAQLVFAVAKQHGARLLSCVKTDSLRVQLSAT